MSVGATSSSRVALTVRIGALLIVQGAALCGCGGQGDRPPLGAVRGTVTLDGQPLADAQVTFAPESGRPSIGRTDSAGRYELTYVMATKGAKVGRHRVFVDWAPVDADVEDGRQKASARPTIPARYGRQSELTADVRGGANTFDFALESK